MAHLPWQSARTVDRSHRAVVVSVGAGGSQEYDRIGVDRPGIVEPTSLETDTRLGLASAHAGQKRCYVPAPKGLSRARPYIGAGTPGHGWIGAGTAFRKPKLRRRGVLVVFWEDGHAEPWMVLTDLPPERVGVCWYGLRVSIELGFRALKVVGWQWEHTQRTDPAKVARHWLVLAVATAWVLAYGTRVEDAKLRGLPPARLHTPPQPAPPPQLRRISVFKQGIGYLHRQLHTGQLWRRLWLAPEPWPGAPPQLHITYHVTCQKATI